MSATRRCRIIGPIDGVAGIVDDDSRMARPVELAPVHRARRAGLSSTMARPTDDERRGRAEGAR